MSDPMQEALDRLDQLFQRAEATMHRYAVSARVSLNEPQPLASELHYCLHEGRWGLYIVRYKNPHDMATVVPILSATARERVLSAHAMSGLINVCYSVANKDLIAACDAGNALERALERL